VSDIAACADELCPSRLSCFRFMRQRDPLGFDTWMDTGRPSNNRICEYFIPTREGDKLRVHLTPATRAKKGKSK
jgi:hypothetical protein